MTPIEGGIVVQRRYLQILVGDPLLHGKLLEGLIGLGVSDEEAVAMVGIGVDVAGRRRVADPHRLHEHLVRRQAGELGMALLLAGAIHS